MNIYMHQLQSLLLLHVVIKSFLVATTNAYSTPSSVSKRGLPIRPSFVAKGSRSRSISSPTLFFAEYENGAVPLATPSVDKSASAHLSSSNSPNSPNESNTEDNRLAMPSMSTRNNSNSEKWELTSSSLVSSSLVSSSSSSSEKKQLSIHRPSPLFFANEIKIIEQEEQTQNKEDTESSLLLDSNDFQFSNSFSSSVLSSSSSSSSRVKPFGISSPSFIVPKKDMLNSYDEESLLSEDKESSNMNTIMKSSPLFFADEVVTTENKLSIPIPTMTTTTTTTLQQHQQKSKPIASSFQPKEYNPHPLLTNEHLQTILGVFIRDDPGCAYINPNATNTFEELFPIAKALISKLPTILGWTKGEAECDYWDERERIRTNDGDFFDVDYKYTLTNKSDNHSGSSSSSSSSSTDDNIYSNVYTPSNIDNDSEGLVIIVHGLESNSNSSVCTNMAKSFHSHNFDVACINFRGCSGVPNDTVYQYHGGFTDDIKHYIQHLTDRRQQRLGENKEAGAKVKASLIEDKPLYISGFSLGSNIVMKCLGELSMDAVTKHNLQGAAVTASPFHLRPHHRRLIDEPFQRTVYAGSILKSMKTKLDYLVETYCDGDTETDKFDYWLVKNATTIAEVEDGMIAPLYGFKDKFDYFDKSASLPLVDDIAVPTFVLNAADDPFFSRTFFPWEKDCDKGGVAPLKLTRTTNGGHLGHLFQRFSPEEKEDLPSRQYQTPVASFALSELGRFINHVHVNVKNENRQ